MRVDAPWQIGFADITGAPIEVNLLTVRTAGSVVTGAPHVPVTTQVYMPSWVAFNNPAIVSEGLPGAAIPSEMPFLLQS